MPVYAYTARTAIPARGKFEPFPIIINSGRKPGITMKKKIAIIVRDRTQEALRMAVGATLANDEVSVFIMDRKLEADEDTEVNLQMLSDLGVPLCTNTGENLFPQKSTADIARMLSGYDVVIPY